MISGKIEKSGNGDDIRLIWDLAGRDGSVKIDGIKVEVGRVLSCNRNAVVMEQLPETEFV